MIFFLASLPNESYEILLEVFKMFEEGQLIKIPKSKMGIASKMDRRGSNFRVLRGLEMDVVSDLLTQVQRKELPFSKASFAQERVCETGWGRIVGRCNSPLPYICR